MDWLSAGWLGTTDYDVARFVLQRGIAAVYVVAFVSGALQFPALLGEHGLLPVPRYLARSARTPGPTLFRWRYSDALLRAVAWTGAALAATLVLGLPQRGPAWLPMLVFLAAVAAVHVDRERGPGLLRLWLGDPAPGGRLPCGLPGLGSNHDAGGSPCGCSAGCCSGWSLAPA